MTSELKEISQTRRELQIEIDAVVIKDAYGKISSRYAKGANIPGFRKGYAPLDVVRVRYKEEIKQEVLQLLLPDRVAAAIREHGLQPLAEPQLHVEDVENLKVNGTEPIKLHVHIEVMPELPEPNYKGIELIRRVKPVEASEVDDLIASRVAQESALMPVEDRPSQIGDTVVADLEGTFDDDPNADPIMADNIEIKLGDELMEASFSENLVGVREDEEKEFSVSYPEDFSSAALAGKTVHYKAKIKSVGIMETPEPDDEWAKSLDEGYESLEDLKKKLLADLESYAEADADTRLRNNAIAKLIEQNEFEVPDALIDNQARNLLNNFAQDLQRQGVDLNKVENEFLQMAFSQMRTQAERDVRGAMLLEKIAEAEKVEVKQEEIDDEVDKMAEYYRVGRDEILASIEKQGGTGSIENNLRTRKTVEAVVGHANVTDGPWVDEKAGEPVVEESKPKKGRKSKAPVKKAAGE